MSNKYIEIICFTVYDVTNFENKLTFLIVFLHEQNFKYLKNKNNFYGQLKSIFHHFKGLSIFQNCLGPKTGHLNDLIRLVINDS